MFGIFKRRNRHMEAASTQEAGENLATNKRKPICIEMSWTGLFSLFVVSFFVCLWMFLLGLWAGQTIFFPVPGQALSSPKTADAPKRSTAVSPQQGPEQEKTDGMGSRGAHSSEEAR